MQHHREWTEVRHLHRCRSQAHQRMWCEACPFAYELSVPPATYNPARSFKGPLASPGKHCSKPAKLNESRTVAAYPSNPGTWSWLQQQWTQWSGRPCPDPVCKALFRTRQAQVMPRPPTGPSHVHICCTLNHVAPERHLRPARHDGAAPAVVQPYLPLGAHVVVKQLNEAVQAGQRDHDAGFGPVLACKGQSRPVCRHRRGILGIKRELWHSAATSKARSKAGIGRGDNSRTGGHHRLHHETHVLQRCYGRRGRGMVMGWDGWRKEGNR